MTPLVLWGASGHAKVLAEFAAGLGYRVVAVFDNADVPPPLPGVPLYRGTDGFARWKESQDAGLIAGLVAIGGSKGEERLAIQEFLSAHGVTPVMAVHPTAFVAGDTHLAPGCQVLAQAAVCAGSRLGRATIVNTAASVDHECEIGDGVHIAPGARLAGCVRVGDFSLVAVGAIVLPRVVIGTRCVVGAGAVVTRNVPDNAVVHGSPARVIRWRPPA